MLETIAHSGYSGVATEMFNADAGAQYEKSLYNVRIEVGELVDKLQRELMPVALEFLKWVKSSVDWIKEHASMLQSLAVGIGVAAAAFYTLNFVQILLLGIENALVAAAVSGASFGTAMLASLGPVALMATAIGGLAMAFSMLGENIEKAKAERNKFLEDSNTKETTYLEELAKSEGGGQKGINAAAAKEKASLQATLKDLQHQMDNSSTERGTEINKQITETLGKINTVDRFQLGLVPKKNGFKNPDGMGKAADKEPKTKATGSKSVTINVSIKDLIGTYNMNVTNIKEMGNNIREHVVAALVSATNDFQLATGQ